MELSNELLPRFLSLASQLSPENLHCDGEISRAAAHRKYVKLRKEWNRLEKEAGRIVSEDEVWALHMKNRGW